MARTDFRQELIGLAFDVLTNTNQQARTPANFAPNYREQLVNSIRDNLTQRGIAVNDEILALARVTVNTMAGILHDNPNFGRNQAIRRYNDIAEGNDIELPRQGRGNRN